MAAVIPLNGRDLMPAGPAKGAMLVKSKVAKSSSRGRRPPAKPGPTGKSDVKTKPPSAPETAASGPRSLDELKTLVRKTLRRGERAFVDEAVGDCEPASDHTTAASPAKEKKLMAYDVPVFAGGRPHNGVEACRSCLLREFRSLYHALRIENLILFRRYDPGLSGTVSRRDCREVLRCLGTSLSDAELGRVVDEAADRRTGRVEYASLTRGEQRPQERRREAGGYAAQYALEKQKQRDRASEVEERLCATMRDSAHVATLRRKLRSADASRSGKLAPCEFARALREYTGEPLEDEDEIAICEAYDHRVPARLLEEDSLKSPAALGRTDELFDDDNDDFDVPLASPRKSRTPREEDEGARALVDRRLFSKRRGQGSYHVKKSKSDEAARSSLWRSDADAEPATFRSRLDDDEGNDADCQRPVVGFRPVLGRSHREPVFDLVDYEKFADNLEKRADEISSAAKKEANVGSEWTATRRRTVKKIAAAVANHEQRNNWDRQFFGVDGPGEFSKPSDAVAAFAALGVDLSRRELLEALDLGRTRSANFDPKALATKALETTEAIETAEEAKKDALFETTRVKAETKRRGGGAAVDAARSSAVLRHQAPSEVSSSRRRNLQGTGYFYSTPTNRPLFLRSEANRDRPSRAVDDSDLPPPAGIKTTPIRKKNHAVSPETDDDDDELRTARSSLDRRERLVFERAKASISERTSRARLAAALEAMPGGDDQVVAADDLQRTLRRVGAPVASSDAARIVARAGGGRGASRHQLADLLLAGEFDEDLGKPTARHLPRSDDDTSRDFLSLDDDGEDEARYAKRKGAAHKKMSSDAVAADKILRDSLDTIALAPNPTFATSDDLRSWLGEKSTPRRARGTARRQDSHPWKWEDLAPGEEDYVPLFPSTSSRGLLEASRAARARTRRRKRPLSAPPKRDLLFADEYRRSNSVPRPLRAFIAEHQEKSAARERLLL
ncbi:hypothetical protein CTAYLR_003736 [Chrysophaeum taylorii]|uniref:EF-hand domain-containing protein n=1 Tax=Chrysophaeum taylorii TaxID=2483200 RepID=A0AAD7UMA9_9STRA|nr:hypothetical protein CTAYLR_003736 [Chrysophaeum taylorii]